MEPIEADIEVSEADWIEAFEAQGQKGNRSAAWLLGILGVGAVVWGALAWPVAPGVWMLMPPMGLLGAVLMLRQSRWTARRAYRATPPAWHAVHLVLDAEHLRVAGPELESYRPWSHVDGWLETPRLFVLLAGGGVGDVWPKAAFDARDQERVRALLDEKLKLPPAPRREREAKVAGRVRLVLWVILFCLLVAAYAVWRSGA